jgi:hypothetical protein
MNRKGYLNQWKSTNSDAKSAEQLRPTLIIGLSFDVECWISPLPNGAPKQPARPAHGIAAGKNMLKFTSADGLLLCVRPRSLTFLGPHRGI